MVYNESIDGVLCGANDDGGGEGSSSTSRHGSSKYV